MNYRVLEKKINDRQGKYIYNMLFKLEYKINNFRGNYFEIKYDKDNEVIDETLLKIIKLIEKDMNVDQDFNTIIVRKFEKDSIMIPHKDSRNIVGESFTIFIGSEFTLNYDDTDVKINSGDIILQECTNGYSMGPKYGISRFGDEMAFTITLCTILKENPV
jgi:hypothetical protein